MDPMRPFISILPRSRAGWIALPALFSCVVCPAKATETVKPGASPKSALRAEASGRGYFGVTLTEICPEVRAQTSLKDGEGLMIGRVDPASPAAALGLLHYDILTRFNDQWLMSPAQFATLVENAGPGAEAEITYLRRGMETKTKVRLGRSPARPLTTESLPPLPEEMLSMVIRALRDNPVLLENIHRLLHGSPSGAPEAGLKQGSKITKFDEHGVLELTATAEEQKVRAWDQHGKLLFEGPCRTPEQLADMPESIRSRVVNLLKECKNTPRQLHQEQPLVQPPSAAAVAPDKAAEAP